MGPWTPGTGASDWRYWVWLPGAPWGDGDAWQGLAGQLTLGRTRHKECSLNSLLFAVTVALLCFPRACFSLSHARDTLAS